MIGDLVFDDYVVDDEGFLTPEKHSAPWWIVNGAAGHYDGIDNLVLPLPSYTRFANDTLYSYSKLTFHNSSHRECRMLFSSKHRPDTLSTLVHSDPRVHLIRYKRGHRFCNPLQKTLKRGARRGPVERNDVTFPALNDPSGKWDPVATSVANLGRQSQVVLCPSRTPYT